jgi:hypothetical protein
MMNKIKYLKILTILLLFVLIITASSTFAKLELLKVFIDGKKTPARTITHEGEIYISVSDLSKAFPGRFQMDINSKQLNIYSGPTEKLQVTAGEKVTPKGLCGEIMLGDKTGKEFPLKGVSIILFTHNPSVPEEISVNTLKQWIVGKDNVYVETHGKIRETKTGADGRFFIGTIPPGNYELVAIYCASGGKSGRFWRKKIATGKDGQLMIKFSNQEAISID